MLACCLLELITILLGEIVEDVSQQISSGSSKYRMGACVHWLEHGSSNMAILEFHLLTGFEADLETLEQV